MIDLLSQLGRGLGDAGIAIAQVLISVLRGIKSGGGLCARFIRDTFRAHHNILGKYTAPIEQEAFANETPPQPENLSLLGQLALTLVPVTVIAWIASITLSPLLMNSIINLIKFYVKTQNLAFFDSKTNQLKLNDGFAKQLPWYRVLYGLPGLLLGALAGAIVGLLITSVRFITNSWKNGANIFVKVINGVVESEKELTKPYTKETHLAFKILGTPGALLGLIAGSIAAVFIGGIRTIKNSWLTSIRTAKIITNFATVDKPDSKIAIEQDKRSFANKIFGAPGYIIGCLPGLIGLTGWGSWRILKNSTITAFQLMISGGQAALKEQYRSADGGIENDPASAIEKYGLGALGLIPGSLLAALAFCIVGFGRIVVNSWVNATNTLSSINRFALSNFEKDSGSDTQASEKQADRANNHDSFDKALGVIGYPIGAMIGALTASLIIAARSLYHSTITAVRIVQSGGIAAMEQKPEAGIQHDKRANNKVIFGLGALGIPIGLALTPLSFSVVALGRSLKHSWFNIEESFVSITNTALSSKRKIDYFAPQRKSFNKAIGFPGYVIGGIAGSIGFAVVTLTRSIIHSTISGVNLVLSSAKFAADSNAEIGFEFDKRNNSRKFGFGLPGLILASPFAALSFIFAGSWRIVKHTSINAFEVFVNATNWAMPASRQINKETAIPARNKLDKRFGFLGYGIGAIAGGLSISAIGFVRMLTNSAKTAYQLMLTGADFALDQGKEPRTMGILHDTRQKRFKFGLGLPGFIPGIVFGLGAFGLCGLARSFKQIAMTTREAFLETINVVLPTGSEREIEQIQRRRINKVLGSPGYLLGYGAGSIASAAIVLYRTIVNSAITAWQMTNSAASIAAIHKESANKLKADNSRNPNEKYGFGLPGMLPGAIMALIAFSVMSIHRIIYNSVINTRKTFVTISEFALPSNSQSEESGSEEEKQALLKSSNPQAQTKRHIIDKHILGIPGYFIGSLLGSISFSAIILSRSVINSVETAYKMMISGGDLALKQSQKVGIRSDSRSRVKQFGFGAPGVLIGAPLGLLAFISVGAYRMVVNSAISSYQLAQSGANLARKHPIEGQGIENDTTRNNSEKYGLGIIGLPIGFILGSLGFATIGVSRILVNTLLNSVKVINTMNAQVLPKRTDSEAASSEEAASGEEADKQTLSDKILGGLGYPLGSLVGLITASVIVIARSLYNSIVTAKQMTTFGTSLALKKPLTTLGSDITTEDRSNHLKFGFGLPGVIPGTVLGFIGFAIAGSARITIESWLNATQIHGQLTTIALGVSTTEEASEVDTEERNSLDKSLGLLGYPLGALSGSIVFAVIYAVRSCYHSWLTIAEMTTSGWQLAWAQRNQNISYAITSERPLNQRYGFGFPGLVIGSIFGALSLTVGGLFRIASDTVVSYLRLSASLINGAFEYPIFNALSGDSRDSLDQGLGGIGYALAVATTLPVTAVIFVARKVIPYGFALTIGVVTSPFVALVKAFSNSHNERFENIDDDVNLTHLQNIYGLIDKWGNLKTQTDVPDESNGRKGAKRFAIKAITFNGDSVTERVLNTIIEAYKASDNNETFFTSAEYSDVLNNIKQYYHGLDCLEYEHNIVERDNTIDALGDFIRQYIQSPAAKATQIDRDFYRRQGNSFSSIFWGSPQPGGTHASTAAHQAANTP